MVKPRGDGMSRKGPNVGKNVAIVVAERIERRIYMIRCEKVILNADLAELYGVETKVLLQSVRRNADRFPDDFMFLLTAQELTTLRSQFVTSKITSRSPLADPRGGRRYRPMAFTEQGVAMLSSVLRSPRAVRVNIEIMRAFVRLRQILATHADLARKLAELETKYDEQFRVVFDAIRALMAEPEETEAETPREPIGFQTELAGARRKGRMGHGAGAGRVEANDI